MNDTDYDSNGDEIEVDDEYTDDDLDIEIDEEIEGEIFNPRSMEKEKPEQVWFSIKVPNSKGYLINKDGSVMGPRGKLKPRVNKLTGYVDYVIRDKRYYIHILMAKTFLGKIPKNYVISHENGIKKDNKLSNLRIRSQEVNMMIHAIQRKAKLNEIKKSKRS